MGDRNNPIKFGPEWLRNMSRERSAGRSSNSQNVNTSQSAAASANPSGPPPGATAASTTPVPPINTNNTSKVLLAKLRYGREEMLALYDRNSEAPSELKYIDTLYQPRGKQPVALNNTFDDDVRDNLRSAPPIGGMPSGERFGIGRGSGRGVINDGRGRPRGSYIRQPSIGRGASWHVSTPRMPYNAGADDDGSIRPWTNTNLNNTNRNSGDQTEWAAKMFRNKRQGSNTNWRQPTREDGEEWRSSESGRPRQLEKWDREWGDRPSGEKSQSWNTNRRGWGGDTQNEENLPEWAGENAECGGTFDSSGAFHGYSNDDTNLPKHQDSSYPLTRSHTHGSFPRPKALEEGSEEWWASEKAKKLSPKRFDASDLKFKKQPGIGIAELPNTTASTNKPSSSKEEQPQEIPEKAETQTAAPEPPEGNATAKGEDKTRAHTQSAYSNKYKESKTFDALMRSDIDLEESSDERSNFQSVIINSNNSLRQKHQHLVAAMNEAATKQGSSNIKTIKKNQNELDHLQHKSPEDMLVDNIFGISLDDKEILSTSSSNSLMTLSSSGMSSALASAANALPQNPSMAMSMSSSAIPSHGMSMDMHLSKQTAVIQPVHQGPAMPPAGLNTVGMPTGMQPGMPSSMQPGLQIPGMPSMPGMPTAMQTPSMQSSAFPSMAMQNPGMSSERMQNMSTGSIQNMSSGGMQNMPSGGIQNMPSSMSAPRVQTPGSAGMQPLQNVGITNSALNASLGLPIGPNIGMPLQGMPQQVMPNVCMANNSSLGGSGINVMGSGSMQGSGNMPGFQSSNSMPGMSNNVGNASLFLQNSNNASMSSSIDMPISNHGGQNNLMHLHGLQQQLSGSQAPFGNSIYSNSGSNLADQWYYEDPERNIQGPFSSKDMYNWYRAGFFSPSLMVRRACETMMRPLGTYGPVVPFAQMDNMMSGFPISGGFERPQGENLLGNQSSLGLDVMNMGSMNLSDNPPMETLQFGSMGLVSNQNYRQPQQMDALWGQPSSSGDLMWVQHNLTLAEARVNNLPVYFWDSQPSAINSNSLLPEEITKEMKTEDQILAQLRATQNIGPPPPPPQSFLTDLPGSSAVTSSEDCFATTVNATPNLEELHKLIQTETLTGSTSVSESENADQSKTEKSSKTDQSEVSVTKSSSQTKATTETKQSKQTKETDKSTKNKENNNTKNKNKKSKDEKKDEVVEVKTKEDEVNKAEKRSQEPSPSKIKKEDKSSKKDLEKEKKEWIKEGFTIVKGSEKSSSKDNKKKAEEARVAEETERKRKEEEKLAAEEEKKKKQAETVKKQQEQQAQQPQRQASESVAKKAPWSAVANQALQATNRDGLTLAEIQRLEREKKLEQMKEQQQMMQIIAQQQAAALAREQEMQAGLGWAKKKGASQSQGQSLAEIQAEARKQAVAAAVAAAAKAMEEAEVSQPPQTNHAPWASTHNGGTPRGFWDTQPKADKQESQKPAEQTKNKKKLTVTTTSKKETSPAVEFESWCTGVLSSWSSKIDVPTFVGFLKDIESPYEVKDYVKCYLGESKDSSDFARQFLERRSKLLRVGMVTPSDDLCSPAIAVNPRTISGSDYQEVKGKGKKAKKNKMLKVDARILGFSVTASEDRINVGDIDTV